MTPQECIALRSEKHGKYSYRAAWVYKVVDGKWKKGEMLFETTKAASQKFNRLLEEWKQKLGLPVLSVIHNQKVI